MAGTHRARGCAASLADHRPDRCLSAESALVRDFLDAARFFAARDPETALWCLLPGEDTVRVWHMVAVGALLTGATARARSGAVVTMPAAARTAAPPRWVRCSVDGQVHLLAAAQVAVAGAGAAVFAPCGRHILAEELSLSGESEGLGVGCLAAGSTS